MDKSHQSGNVKETIGTGIMHGNLTLITVIIKEYSLNV